MMNNSTPVTGHGIHRRTFPMGKGRGEGGGGGDSANTLSLQVSRKC